MAASGFLSSLCFVLILKILTLPLINGRIPESPGQENYRRLTRSVKSIHIERTDIDEPPSLPPRPTLTPSLCQQYGFYCGTQLAKMGYRNTQPNTLYECNDEQNALFYKKCGHGYDCAENGRQSFCKCRPGMQYCGFELRLSNYHLPVNSDHSLFFCNVAQQPRKIESCSGRCQMNYTGDSVCTIRSWGTECQPGTRYCGLELTARKYTRRWSPHVLYECGEYGDIRRMEWCKNACSPTTSNCKEGISVTKPPGIY